MAVMATFLHFENSNCRSDRVDSVCRSEERGLGEANTSSSPASDAARYLCLIDNTTLLNATCDALLP